MRPEDKAKAAVVIEFKHIKVSKATKAKIKAAAQAALKQIVEKGYTGELEAEGYRKILKYGIAFNGKYCIVENG